MELTKKSNSEKIGALVSDNRICVANIDKNIVMGLTPKVGYFSISGLSTLKRVTKYLAEEERLIHIRLNGSICDINGELVRNYRIRVSNNNPNSRYPSIYVSYTKDLSELYKKIVRKIVAINPSVVVLEISCNPLQGELDEFINDKFHRCV